MDKNHLIKLANTKMPFGKYKGHFITDLPEDYMVWFEKKGFPEGEFGNLLKEVYEIKVNGLEFLFKEIRKS